MDIENAIKVLCAFKGFTPRNGQGQFCQPEEGCYGPEGEITVEGEGYCYGEGIRISYDGEEWDILTDEEADRAWNAALDSYLEDCVYPELSGNLAHYFDDEKWKRDAKYDGRGHSLSGYDSAEEGVKVGGVWFYLYRQD